MSIVSEDWRYRMTTPPKGDYAGVPLNAAGRRAADAWYNQTFEGHRTIWMDGRPHVLATGDVFTTTRYPQIDVQNGGSVQGEIRALNDILNRTVYQHEGEGGTIVVPGHGYVSDEHEVVEYRDMVAIVRDRVQAMIRKGATLDQVKAARPTADYDTRYGATSGAWTTDRFVEALYTSLTRR